MLLVSHIFFLKTLKVILDEFSVPQFSQNFESTVSTELNALFLTRCKFAKEGIT